MFDVAILLDALASKPKTHTWSEAMGKAFVATKKALAEVALLSHRCHGFTAFTYTTDAPDQAVLAVLLQLVSKSWEPLYL